MKCSRLYKSGWHQEIGNQIRLENFKLNYVTIKYRSQWKTCVWWMGLEHICKQILTHRTGGRSSVECSVSLRYDQRILQLGQWVIHGPNSWIQWKNSAFFLKLLHTTSGMLRVAPTSFVSLHIHRAVIYKVYTGLTSTSIQFIPYFVKIAQLVQTFKWQVTRTHTRMRTHTHTHTHTHHSELHALIPTLMEWQQGDFASRLFYDAASVSDYTVLMVGRGMSNQTARIWKVMVVTGTSMYYPSTLLERLRKTTRSVNQDSTLTNIQTGHPPNKILQHYYYSNVIGRVGWNTQ